MLWKYGRLTVLEELSIPNKNTGKIYKYFKCLCECGTIKDLLKSNVVSGKTTSCGCYQKERIKEERAKTRNIPKGARNNLVGNRYGNLVVVSAAANKGITEINQVGKTAWNCLCDCGEMVIRTTGALKKKNNTPMCATCKSNDASNKLRKFKAENPHCTRFIDYSGRRYGRLLVLNRYPENIKGRTTYIVFCDCGTFKLVSREALDGGRTNSCGCFRREDSRNKMLVLRPTQVGPNNPSWNPNLTDEDRIDRRTLEPVIEWAKDVKARDKYTCKICGIHNNLHSHHLDSYRAHPERRVDPSNGVTLCKDCHKKFHSTYGRKVTYEWQFVEYYFKNQNQKFLKLDIAA